MSEIRIATAHDADEVGRILADGFHEDPVMGWVFQGDDDARAAKLTACFAFLATEATVPLGATFLVDGGCACWTPPPGTDEWPPDRGTRFIDVLRATCDDGDIERLGVLSSAMDEAHPSEPHWYLGSIATVRPRQRTGIGSALLRHCLAIVDGAGTPAYLESTNPRNITLYERHGFRSIGEIALEGGPPVTPMWREPGGR